MTAGPLGYQRRAITTAKWSTERVRLSWSLPKIASMTSEREVVAIAGVLHPTVNQESGPLVRFMVGRVLFSALGLPHHVCRDHEHVAAPRKPETWRPARWGEETQDRRYSRSASGRLRLSSQIFQEHTTTPPHHLNNNTFLSTSCFIFHHASRTLKVRQRSTMQANRTEHLSDQGI